MPIYDQSYKHYDGSFRSHSFRWWVIVKYGIKTAFKKKAVRFLFAFALFPCIGGAVYIYGLTHLGQVSNFVKQIAGDSPMPDIAGKVYEVEVDGDPAPFLQALSQEGIPSPGPGPRFRVVAPEGESSKIIFAIAKRSGTKIKHITPPGTRASFYREFLNWQTRYLFLLLIVVGSGLIAKDVKFNALQIYLAKPITGLEYILGKLGIVVFFLIVVTLVPGLFLFLFQAILVGDSLYFRHYWWVPAAISGYSLVIVFSGSLLVLALSALSRNARSAAFGVAALFVFSPMIAELLRSSTRNENYLLVSFRHNWTSVGQEIFGVRQPFDTSWGWSLLIVAMIAILCAGVLVRRVRAVEVVK